MAREPGKAILRFERVSPYDSVTWVQKGEHASCQALQLHRQFAVQ